MDFWRTVMVLLRRWYITVPAFVATLGVGAAAYSARPVEYQSDAILVLTTPLAGGSESTSPHQPRALTNPLMNFDQSLALAASIVIQQMSSSEAAQALGIVPGGTTSYVVNNGSTNPELLQTGPFIFVAGTGPSPEAAQDIATKASTMAATVLVQRQDALKAPASTQISLQVVVPPTAGQPLTGSAKRAAAALAGLAGLMSLVAVYGFESMAHRRRRRAAQSRHARSGSAVVGPLQAELDEGTSAADRPWPRPDREVVGTLRLTHADVAPEKR